MCKRIRIICHFGAFSTNARAKYILLRNNTHGLFINVRIYQVIRKPHGIKFSTFSLPSRNSQRLASDPLFCLRLSAGHLSQPLGAKTSCVFIAAVLLPFVPLAPSYSKSLGYEYPSGIHFAGFRCGEIWVCARNAAEYLRDISMAAAAVGYVLFSNLSCMVST